MSVTARPGAAGRVRADLVARAQRHTWFLALLAAGVAVRLALLPRWHGQDFTVWTLASSATLRGIDIYVHHPAYPGGPYAYLPVFLAIEVPLRYLSQHGGPSFVVLGKLPMLAADVAIAALLYRLLLRRGCTPRRAVAGAAVFLLNPLVLYNSAYYGRFDSLGCALLLAATAGLARGAPLQRRHAALYGLAVAVKTFPIFALGAVARAAQDRRRLLIVLTVVVLVGVSLPYLAAPVPYVRDIVGYDNAKLPTGLSPWIALDPTTSARAARLISDLGIPAFLAGAVVLARRLDDLVVAIAAALVLFLVCSKLVLEQYLIWPMPWLILLAAGHDRELAVRSRVLIAGLTVAGMLDNESVHPFGRNALVVALPLLALNCWYLVQALRAVGRSERFATPAAAC